ncbi:AMIN-like domain-containing (lipo)protein [Speluncibacter jeojiensis]
MKPDAQAIPHGGGAPVNVGGAGLLHVDAVGTSPSTSSGARQYSGPDDLTMSGVQPVVAVHFTGSVDQITQAFVGTAASRRHRGWRGAAAERRCGDDAASAFHRRHPESLTSYIGRPRGLGCGIRGGSPWPAPFPNGC